MTFFTEPVIKILTKSKTMKRVGALKHDAGFIQLLAETDFLPPSVMIAQRLWHVEHNIHDIIRCKMCGNSAPWDISRRQYRTYCSSKCAHQDPDFKRRMAEQNIKQFGSTSPFGNKTVQEKSKMTVLSKYGTDNVSKANDIKNKKRQTSLTKYGVNHPMQFHTTKEKLKNTCIETYGVDNPRKDQHVKQKIKNTMVEKYGAISPMLVPAIRCKIQQTNLVKYGVEWNIASNSSKHKKEQTLLLKYGKHNPIALCVKTNDHLTKDILDMSYDQELLFSKYTAEHHSIKQISEIVGMCEETIRKRLHQFGIPVRDRMQFSSTMCMLWLTSVMKEERIDIQHAFNGGEYAIPNTRYRVDGYCKETNTVYEFHGDLWHGNPKIFSPDDRCHPWSELTAGELYQKTIEREELIKSLGYNLVVMWEYDFIDKIGTKR